MGAYLLQIVDDAGRVVCVGVPGARLPFEVDLITRCTQAITARGVGLLKTRGQVEQAIREGMDEVFREFKRSARPLVQQL